MCRPLVPAPAGAWALVGERRALRVRAPDEVLDLLRACTEPLTLDGLAAKLGAWLDLDHGARAEVRELLERAAGEGILVGDDVLRARVAGKSSSAGTCTSPGVALDHAFVPTCDRPAFLGRSLASYVRNTREHGRRPSFVVFDDSRDPAMASASRAIAERIGRRYGASVGYCGEAHKRRFVRELAKLGIARDEATFALLPPDRYAGANRNAMLLHAVGTAFMSFDDDTVCAVERPPAAGRKLRVASYDPTELWFHPPRVRTDVDLLGELSRWLGRTVSECARSFGDRAVELGPMAQMLVGRLEAGSGRVVASVLGATGDLVVGSAAPHLLVCAGGDSRKRLFAHEDTYRRVRSDHRAMRCAKHANLGDGGTCFFPSTVVALDGRGLLPPFFPARRGDDPLFGVELDYCVPGALVASLPLAVLHRRPLADRRRASRDARERVRDGTPALQLFAFLELCIRASGGEPPSGDRASRMRAIGTHLVSLGELSPAALARILDPLWASHVANLRRGQTHLLRRRRSCATWRRDMERHARYWAAQPDAAHIGDVADIAARLRKTPEAVGRHMLGAFGRLLAAWPDLCEAARELRRRGRSLVEEVTP